MEKIFNSLYPKYEKSIFNFKNKFSYEKRYTEAKRIRFKYPDRIPVICQMIGKNLPDLDKKKYLVPDDLTKGKLIYLFELGIWSQFGQEL